MSSPEALVKVRSVDELSETVSQARARGRSVRVVGSGHSFSPLVATDDVIVDLGELSGILEADVATATARIWAGSTIRDLGPALWREGLSLRNQGGIEGQTLGGVVGTATHGSGRRFTSMSGAVSGLEYVAADGSVNRVDHQSDHFDAFRTAFGSLGVFTQIELQLAPAYQLLRTDDYWPLAKVFERWEHETSTRRHFAFYLGALEGFQVNPSPHEIEDACYVQFYDELPADAIPLHGDDRLMGPSYEIYPWFKEDGIKYHEMEYFVPFDSAIPAIEAVRKVMEQHAPLHFPLEVRTVASETGWLSPMFGGDRVALSVSGLPGTDYWPYFHDVDTALADFDARPHWGKFHHLFDRARLAGSYPRFENFVNLRRDLDPHGVFLNDHLRPLVG